MIVQDSLSRQVMVAGLLLIVSGLTAVTMRRRLVVNLLGIHLSVLGGALLMAQPGSRSNGRTAAVLLAASTLIAPVGLAAAARWRRETADADQTTLLEAEEVPR